MKLTTRDKEKLKSLHRQITMDQMESQVSEKALEAFRRPAYTRVPLKNKHERDS